MMYTRTAFTHDCERELWRVHLDEMQINLCNNEWKFFEKGVSQIAQESFLTKTCVI